MSIKFFDSLFPQRCCGCDRLTRTELPFCNECERLVLIPDTKKSACDVCGLQLGSCLCGKKQFFHKSAAIFLHEGNPRRVIFKLKFRSRPDLARTYARALKIVLDKRSILGSTDIITCIPMTRFAKIKRGYNQSELLARRLSEISGIEFIPVLKKQFSTPKQHKTAGASRRANILGAFEPEKEFIPLIQNKRILIIDDVTTTGNTMNEAAKTLLIFGADEIFAASCTARKKPKKMVEHK